MLKCSTFILLTSAQHLSNICNHILPCFVLFWTVFFFFFFSFITFYLFFFLGGLGLFRRRVAAFVASYFQTRWKQLQAVRFKTAFF